MHRTIVLHTISSGNMGSGEILLYSALLGPISTLCGFFLCLYHHSTTVMIASNCPLNHTRLSGKGISSQRYFSSLMSVADDTLCT